MDSVNIIQRLLGGGVESNRWEDEGVAMGPIGFFGGNLRISVQESMKGQEVRSDVVVRSSGLVMMSYI